MATITGMIIDLKFRAGSFSPVTLVKFLIPKQIRRDMLWDQVHKAIAN
jgi:hypothetical protein